MGLIYKLSSEITPKLWFALNDDLELKPLSCFRTYNQTVIKAIFLLSFLIFSVIPLNMLRPEDEPEGQTV